MHDVLSHRHKKIPLCRKWRGIEERERGGLLTWLEWLFCSCAIISGGVLRAALQHHFSSSHTCRKITASEVPSAVI